jgi:hypothetical protein
MRVMVNILREKLSEPRTIRGVLYDYGDFFGDSGRAVEALYVQGYAAIFMLKADFPLSPPAPQDQAETQKTEPADPVWQRARDRLYTPQTAGPYGAGGGVPREADQKSFDEFKDDLIKTLKHAVNIRNMDANELVILTITGQSEAALPGMPGTPYGAGRGGGGWVRGGSYGGAGGYASGGGGGMGGMGGYGSSSGSFNYGGGGSFQMDSRSQPGVSRGRSSGGRMPQAPASTTMLTIQAKKSDIDAFAKGTLPLDVFQQRVKVFTY